MQMPWLENYPEGMPARIETQAYSSLVDLLDQACKKHASRVVCTSFDVSMTFADLDRYAKAFAGWLHALSLPRGARVALMLPNVPAYLVALLGTLRAGHVVVNVNPMYTPRELELQLRDSGASVIVVFESFAHVVDKIQNCPELQHRVVVAPGDMLGFLKGMLINFGARHIKKMVPRWQRSGVRRWADVLSEGLGVTWHSPEIHQADLAILQYTGGTTGIPKGAMLTHANLIANVLQIQEVAQPALKAVLARPLTMFAALPLYHVFAMTICLFYGIHAGMKNVLIINPRDRKSLIQNWKKYPVHVCPGVNTLFNALIQEQAFAALDFSALKLTFGGGMALQPTVAARWKALTGGILIQGYGLSECSPVVAANPTNATFFSGAVGLPVPSTEIMIVDAEGQSVALGVHGEIAIRGPQVMQGYWNAPEETARTIRSDGFLMTGDIGWMDEKGFVYIADRKKDMILVSGFNVYPSEIEAVVSEHEAVLECAAIGIPDAHSGEAVKLFVVSKTPTLSESHLKEWCSSQLARYKCPRFIEFCETLPKSNVGKVLRRALRHDV